VVYHRADGEVTLEYVINGSARGSVTRAVHDYEDNLEFLALSSDDVTVFWDDLRVVQMTGDTGPEIPSIGGLENPPTDPDNDGVYEDINGDGRVDIVDVQGFFNNYEGETVQNNPDAFDFNGDGRVNIVDVQQLFSEL
jgi:PKD repeat protein